MKTVRFPQTQVVFHLLKVEPDGNPYKLAEEASGGNSEVHTAGNQIRLLEAIEVPVEHRFQ